MEIYKDIPAFYAKDRKTWRRWLQKNHATETRVWLIIYKKDSPTPSVNYAEAVEEGLCFGWIDSKPNKRDEDSFYLSFTRRKPKSVWSKINKERIERLSAAGLLAPAGIAAIEKAKENGSWNTLDVIDNLVIPDDLAKALSKNKQAKQHFDQFSISSQKIILTWIYSAKRPETRQARIATTIELAAQNIKANQ
ncbi:YdeI/OmpD-associated family protein [Panacibacter microcysteis]|uniref:YdeI/OmpD-associated family protein n=1 Tax=Panacibacter microcysteis TaxID=2793269 RepID=UPI0018CAF2D9|nr:YdeI/OmpD-associated family protein [Panacibacter microcysteis]